MIPAPRYAMPVHIIDDGFLTELDIPVARDSRTNPPRVQNPASTVGPITADEVVARLQLVGNIAREQLACSSERLAATA
jgi:hypothetical protein